MINARGATSVSRAFARTQCPLQADSNLYEDPDASAEGAIVAGVPTASSANPPREHHRVPQWHLRRFADETKRTLVARPDGSRRLLAVKRASVVRDYYAFVDARGEFDQGFEVAFGQVETVAARIAREMLADAFPPRDADRLEFAGFLALQIVRGEMFRVAWERLVATARAVPLRNFTMHAMVRDLPQLANVLLRMRWRLWRFREPCLFTGDQPVAYWRHGDSPRFFDGIGPLTAEQVRFVLDPRHVLVLTWEGGTDDERVVERGARVAAAVNRFTGRWCEHELYCHPELAGELPARPVEPLEASVDPTRADALVQRLSRLSNWREAAYVADAPDWGEPAEGYGLANGRRVRCDAARGGVLRQVLSRSALPQ